MPGHRVRRIRLGTAAGALLLTLGACGSPGGGAVPSPAPLPEPSGARAAPAPVVPAGFTHRTLEQNCTDSRYPLPLTVEAESFSEVPTLTLVDACTNEAQDGVYLGNRSDLVWRLYSDPAGAPVLHSTRGPAALVLSEAVGAVAMMEPGSGVVVQTEPGDVHWYADPALTGAYTAVVALQEKAIESAVGNAPNAFREGTRARAHVTCAAATWSAAQSAASIHEAESDVQKTQAVAEGVESVLSGAGECRTALREADSAQLAERRIARPVLAELEAVPRPNRVAVIARPVQKTWVVTAKTVVRILT